MADFSPETENSPAAKAVAEGFLVEGSLILLVPPVEGTSVGRLSRVKFYPQGMIQGARRPAGQPRAASASSGRFSDSPDISPTGR